MEAPLYHLPVPISAPGVPALPATLRQNDATIGAVIHQQQQQQHQAAAVITAQKKPPPSPPPPTAMATGREQRPRCASRDTKFCYYNNYNTAQPRHFCRACRRYWTLGGSLRNVPVGGSTRKRPRPAPPTRALAAAVATMSSSGTTTTTTTAAAPSCSGPSIFGGSPVPAPAQAPAPAQNGSLLSSLLVGSTGASDLFAYPAFSAGQLLCPATVLDGDRAETTSKAGGAFPLPFPPANALWQELAAAMPSAAGAGAPQPQPQLLL